MWELSRFGPDSSHKGNKCFVYMMLNVVLMEVPKEGMTPEGYHMRTHEVCVCDQCKDVRAAQEAASKTCLDKVTFWKSCRDAEVISAAEMMQVVHLELRILSSFLSDDAEIAALTAQAERLLAGQAGAEGARHV